jgi:hypothetical protein
MAGKFINKAYSNTIDALTTGMIQKVKTANYVFNNKPPVIGDWYNIDKDSTTLDEGTGAEYSAIGSNSPIRYKLIKDAVFYAQGIQIEIDLEYDEGGLTSAPPSISGIVLPNTWIHIQVTISLLSRLVKNSYIELILYLMTLLIITIISISLMLN